MLKSIFYLNEQGRRENLEDSIYPLPGQATLEDDLFMVCDGVGGENKGEEASRILCEAIPQYFNTRKNSLATPEVLQAAVAFATEQLKEYAVVHPVAERMSSTLTLCRIEKNRLAIAWCGDSRVYHVRDGRVLWKSTDHSLVMELVKKGEITEEEAATHPAKNMIMRSLGAGDNSSTVDAHYIEDYKVGDYILLCTDGVLENITEQSIHTILGTGQQEKDRLTLFLDICLGNTKDNFSLYLLELGEDARPPAKNSIKRTALWLGIIVLVAVLTLFLLLPKRSQPENAVVRPAAQHSSGSRSPAQKATDSSLLKALNKNLNPSKANH
jgi:serine/threonine protein phosphatase PrpC